MLRSGVQVTLKEKELYEMSTTEEILNATFKKVGNDFGYETSAEYAAFRDLKVRWRATGSE